MGKPTKEQVRQWQEKNRAEKRPPVSPEQARRELGWDLLKDDKKQRN